MEVLGGHLEKQVLGALLAALALATTTATSSVVILTGAAPTSMAPTSRRSRSSLSSLGGLLGISFGLGKALLLSLGSPLLVSLALEVSSQRI